MNQQSPRATLVSEDKVQLLAQVASEMIEKINNAVDHPILEISITTEQQTQEELLRLKDQALMLVEAYKGLRKEHR